MDGWVGRRYNLNDSKMKNWFFKNGVLKLESESDKALKFYKNYFHVLAWAGSVAQVGMIIGTAYNLKNAVANDSNESLKKAGVFFLLWLVSFGLSKITWKEHKRIKIEIEDRVIQKHLRSKNKN
jgi:hypothetical protein